MAIHLPVPPNGKMSGHSIMIAFPLSLRHTPPFSMRPYVSVAVNIEPANVNCDRRSSAAWNRQRSAELLLLLQPTPTYQAPSDHLNARKGSRKLAPAISGTVMTRAPLPHVVRFAASVLGAMSTPF